MKKTIKKLGGLVAGSAALLAAMPAQAETVLVTLNLQNLAPQNSVSFAPLRFGFHSGVFDAFNNGETATAPIISIAEGGSGSDWLPAFAAADPGAVIGSSSGPLTPGGEFTTTSFLVDTELNPFFTFAALVVPSNDHFIGNDDPTAFRLFDADGNLQITSIDQNAGDIWNAGSEIFDPAAAAFLVGGTNALRTPENGVVRFEFDELAGYNGLTTAAGYDFFSGLNANTAIYRINFSVSQVAGAVPEPATWAFMIFGFGAVGGAMRTRRKTVTAKPALA